MTKGIPLPLLLAMALVIASPVDARVTILDETFLTHDRLHKDLPNTTAWFSSTSASHVEHSPSQGRLTLSAASNSSRHVIAYLTESAGEVIALAAGETLVMRYAVTFTNPHANVGNITANSFRVGLFDSQSGTQGAGRVTADDAGGVLNVGSPTIFDSYVGYRFDAILHENTNAQPTRIFRRNSDSIGSALLVLGAAYSPAIASGGTATRAPGGLYNGEVRIHRLESGEVRVSHRLTGGASPSPINLFAEATDGVSEAIHTFDSVAFGINSRVADSFTLHSVEMFVQSDEFEEIVIGHRTIRTDKYTATGTPVVPMWTAPMPTAQTWDAAGFPVLSEAEHALVWQPMSRDEGAFNHYATLINFEGRFFAMWANHTLGEDGPGQRILYATSDEWGVWSEARELFPAPGPIKERTEVGIHLKPDRWMVIEGDLYAVVWVFDAGRYPIARRVNFDGSYENAFYVNQPPTNATEFPVFMEGVPPPPGSSVTAARIRVWYNQNFHVSWWGRETQGVPRFGVDGAALIESFAYRAPDGGQVLFARNWGTPSNPVHNNRLYVSFRASVNDPWDEPYPTDIPDSPSRAEALTLADGTVLLIGNQIAPEFERALYLNRDPITVAISDDGYTFDRVFALRTNARTQFRFTGVGGRVHGYAYSQSIVHDGWLYTFYSISKEDMGITRVPLSAIGLTDRTPGESVFDDAEDLGHGWRGPDWFGPVLTSYAPVLYSVDHGWLLGSERAENGFFFFHPEVHWFWTDPEIYPFLFVPGENRWYYFDRTLSGMARFIHLSPGSFGGATEASGS